MGRGVEATGKLQALTRNEASSPYLPNTGFKYCGDNTVTGVVKGWWNGSRMQFHTRYVPSQYKPRGHTFARNPLKEGADENATTQGRRECLLGGIRG